MLFRSGLEEASVEEKVGIWGQEGEDMEVEGKNTKTDSGCNTTHSEVSTALSQQDAIQTIFSGLINSLAYRLKPEFNTAKLAGVLTASTQCTSQLHTLELLSGFFKPPINMQHQAGSSEAITTAAVLTNALKKCKVDIVFPEPEEVPRRKLKHHISLVYDWDGMESQMEQQRRYVGLVAGPSRHCPV